MDPNCSSFTIAFGDEGGMDYCAIFSGTAPDAVDHNPDWMCAFKTQWVKTVESDMHAQVHV